MDIPSVFVGSSSEARAFADAIRTLLEHDARIVPWYELSMPGKTFIEKITSALRDFDFAILVLNPDDVIRSRRRQAAGPRDNVLFELGLFMGHLGRDRTFMVQPSKSMQKIPSDLAGVEIPEYQWPRADGSHLEAMRPVCEPIRAAIRSHGFAPAKRIDDLRTRQESAESDIRALQAAFKAVVTKHELKHLRKLAAEGQAKVSFSEIMVRELERLDSIEYVKPLKPHGLNAIREERGSRRDDFDLKQYVRITDEGREYLRMGGSVLQQAAGA